jgi:hypothetical protein
MRNDAKFLQESCYSLWPVALCADRARVEQSRVAQASACVILNFAHAEMRTD